MMLYFIQPKRQLNFGNVSLIKLESVNVKQQTKYKYKRKLKYMQYAYSENLMTLDEISEIINSYHAHLAYGHTYHLQKSLLKDYALKKTNT